MRILVTGGAGFIGSHVVDAYVTAGHQVVVAIFCQNLMDGVVPEIHWDGEQTRGFAYVGDCARANLLTLERGDGQAYNVGTGTGTSINTLFYTLMEVAGKDMAPRRAGDARDSYLDCSKIRDELGWQATVNLREGLEKTWTNFTQQG